MQGRNSLRLEGDSHKASTTIYDGDRKSDACGSRCMPVQPPGCFPRRPRRYNPDNPPPPRPARPSPAKNTVVLKPNFTEQKGASSKAPPMVPVFGVQMGGAGETTLEDMAAMLIERAKVKKAAQDLRPAWDSSWKIGMTEAEEEAVGCLSDVAGALRNLPLRMLSDRWC
eukprot:36707-Rhodomonas_salina.3